MEENPKQTEEEPIVPDSLAELDDDQKLSPLRLLTGFFLVPVIIVLIGIGCFLVYSAISQNEKSPADLLEVISSSSGVNKPWQAAFELSRRLSEGPTEPAFVKKLVATFEKSKGGDPRIRCFLALAMANVKDEKVLENLRFALSDESSEVRIHAIIALGLYGEKNAVADLIPFLDSEDGGEVKSAICSLGMLQSDEAADRLKEFLDDESDEVRWNAAVALANLGEQGAAPVLMKMIDRNYLAEFKATTPVSIRSQETAFGWWGRTWPFGNPIPGFNDAQQERVIQHGLSGLSKLKAAEAVPAIRKLLEDENDNVRWYAALSLTQFSDSAGVEVLESRLDRRGLLRRGYGYDASNELMKGAIQALQQLKPISSRPILQKLNAEDPSEEIRVMAQKALMAYEER